METGDTSAKKLISRSCRSETIASVIGTRRRAGGALSLSQYARLCRSETTRNRRFRERCPRGLRRCRACRSSAYRPARPRAGTSPVATPRATHLSPRVGRVPSTGSHHASEPGAGPTGARRHASAKRRAACPADPANIDPAPRGSWCCSRTTDRCVRPRTAWQLGISKPAATRLLDRAESNALIDKLTPTFDRRDRARLEQGSPLQHTVQRLVDETTFTRRKAGNAYGIRATNPHDHD